MVAFSEQQRKRFEDEMVVHLTREFPDEAAKMGEAWLREMIREGIGLAEKYDIVLEEHVAQYLELMLALSPDFDDNPKTPWAKETLNDRRLIAPQKLELIYQHIMFDQPAGQQEGG